MNASHLKALSLIGSVILSFTPLESGAKQNTDHHKLGHHKQEFNTSSKHTVKAPTKATTALNNNRHMIHQCSIFDNTTDSLACAMYFEARGDGDMGMLLVGETVLNRTQMDEYPTKVKSVIFQPWQFSYNNRRKGDRKIVVRKVYENESWEAARVIAKFLLKSQEDCSKVHDKMKSLLRASHGAIMYHKVGEKVKWGNSYTRLFTYKGHIFYK